MLLGGYVWRGRPVARVAAAPRLTVSSTRAGRVKVLVLVVGVLTVAQAQAQQGPATPPTARRFSTHELSVNAFRNPSIGLEYRYRALSVHAGYYPTNFTSGRTTSFLKTGLTAWFLPAGRRANPSSFYASLAYLRGLDREYENKNGAAVDVGFRWMVWRGLNLRLGVLALKAPGESLKINPTPGISYSFFWE